MNITQFVHEGLGNSSYLLETGDGGALLVDPDRSVDRYLAAAEARGVAIAGVLETHLHADFVSGVHELSAGGTTRAYVPAGSQAQFEHVPVNGGEAIAFSGVSIESIHTPGHTPEHLSYVIRPQSGPPLLFSGGSLIVGGAARTDLIAPAETDALTREQFRSVRERFKTLPEETVLYPTHGAGSFCSTGTGGERTSTLGQERATNPVFLADSEDAFSEWFPQTFPAAPAYFFKLRPINQRGPRLRSDIPLPRALAPEQFERARHAATVVDVRPMRDFMAAHIPGSLSNALRDAFATWLGWLLPLDAPLLFVVEPASMREVVDQAMLVGFENFAGYLDGGIAAWETAGLPTEGHATVDAAEARRLLTEGAVALDVRENSEYETAHIPDALHIPLGELARRTAEVPDGRPVVVYCGHGERAASGVSLLARSSSRELANLDGGIGAWANIGFAIEARN